MTFLYFDLQPSAKSHKHFTYLLRLTYILETGVCCEHYGECCTALYGSIQLHTATRNSIWQVMYCTRFFLYMIYISHHNFLWSKYLSSMKYILSHPPIFSKSPPHPAPCRTCPIHHTITVWL